MKVYGCSLIADTRESAAAALNASNAYKSIIDAINKAWNASMEAVKAAEDAKAVITQCALCYIIINCLTPVTPTRCYITVNCHTPVTLARCYIIINCHTLVTPASCYIIVNCLTCDTGQVLITVNCLTLARYCFYLRCLL